MEYKGKLYGKVGKGYFPLIPTTDDWEQMERRIAELEAENSALKQAHVIKSVCEHNWVTSVAYKNMHYCSKCQEYKP